MVGLMEKRCPLVSGWWLVLMFSEREAVEEQYKAEKGYNRPNKSRK